MRLALTVIAATLLAGCSVPSGGYWAQTDRATNRDVRAVKAQCQAVATTNEGVCACMIKNGYSWQNAINRQCPLPGQY